MLERAKALGMDPQALKDRPDIPWYVESLQLHFQKLSFSRSYSSIGPQPIDIQSIFSYNNHIVNMDPDDFLIIIQALDAVFLTPKKKESDGN